MKAIKSIIKAVDIMELFSGANREMALGDIAKSLKMDEATVSHIVSTLVAQGFLKQSFRRGKYSLGVRFLDLGGTIDGDSKNTHRSISYLTDLSRLVDGSVHLFFWNAGNVSLHEASDYYAEYLEMAPYDKGKPLHCTATGKLILAGVCEEDLNRYFHNLPQGTSTLNTISNIDELKDILSIVKRENIAFDIESNVSGLNAIAVGIKKDDGTVVGAVFIIGLCASLTGSVLKKVTPSLKACALKISQELGYTY
jgi:IclR family KDG regulon transcriptional repressor